MDGTRATAVESPPRPNASQRARRGLPVRALLSALALAALLPALGLAGLLAVRFAEAERAALRDEGRDAARLIVAAIDRQVAAIEATLVALASSPTLAAADLAAFHAQASSLRAVAKVDFVLAAADGRHLLNTRAPFGEMLPPLGHTERYRETTEHRRRVVSGVFIGTLAERAITLVAIPVTVGADAQPAALAASMDAAAFWTPLLATALGSLPPGAIAKLIDAEGVIVGRAPDGAGLVGRPLATQFAAEIVAAVAAGAAGGWLENQRTQDGERVQVAWQRSGATGWTALVALPDAVVAAPVRRALWPLLGGGGVLLVIGLWLARRLASRLAAPLRALAAGATPAHPAGIAEVDALAAGLADARARSLDAEEALRAGEERLRLAFDHARLGHFTWDTVTDTVTFSRRASAIFGLPEDAPAPSWTGLQQLLHPDDRARVRAEVDRVVAERADYAIEYRIRRPADGLEVWIAALGRGRYDEGDGSAIGMIGVVQDVTERKTAEAALRAERDRAQRYFEAAKTTLLVLGPDRRLREINAAGAVLLGAGRAQLLDRDWVESFLPPEDRERVARRLLAFAAGEDPPALYEGRVLRADGEIRLVDWRTIALREADGRFAGLLSSGEDVTERRAAAERQALLSREVDHRARNALAIVQAVLRLTRAETVPKFARAVEGRVAALARAHGLLAEERWEAADLRSILEQELAPFADGAPAVTLSGPVVAVRPTAVQAVAMAFHELATNAAKYGGLSTPDGRLVVQWLHTAGDMLEIEWTETTGTRITTPRHRGFGSRVLEATVRTQLEGALAREWRADGLSVRLSVPRRHLLAIAA